MNHEQLSSPATAWYRTRNGRFLLLLAGVGGIYVLIEHWAHALPYLPWLLLLACPLMHVFMHHGHGGHGHGDHGTVDQAQSDASAGGGPDKT